MLCKSSLFAAMSGKVAGFVASHNRGGQYVRNLVIPTNPSTAAQQVVRDHLSSLAAAWQALTDANRDTWATYANAVTSVNRLGDATKLSAFNWYVSTNSLRLLAGMSTLADAPSTLTRAVLSPVSMTVADGTPAICSVAFESADEWANHADGRLFVFAARPVSPARRFFKGPFQFAGTKSGATPVPAASPFDANSPFGAVADQRVYARVVCLNSDGRTSPEQIVSAIAA